MSLQSSALCTFRSCTPHNSQVALLRSRIDHLEARNQAGRDMQERTVSQLEEDNRTIRNLRLDVQRLSREKEVMEAYQRRSEDLEEEVREARDANRELEDRIKELCQNPFIHTKSASRAEYDELMKLR